MARPRTIYRLSTELIARRRQAVEMLDRLAKGPQEIVEYLFAHMTEAIESQGDPAETIRNDIKVLRQRQQADIAAGLGWEELAEFVDALRELMAMAFRDHDNMALSDDARMAALALALKLRKDIARAMGHAVDADAPLGTFVITPTALPVAGPSDLDDDWEPAEATDATDATELSGTAESLARGFDFDLRMLDDEIKMQPEEIRMLDDGLRMPPEDIILR